MTTVKVLNEDSYDLWDRFVMDHPHSIAWHLSDWSRLVGRHHGASLKLLVARENGHIEGGLPLYQVKTLRGGVQFVSVPYAVAGGVLGQDPDICQALVEEAIHLMKEAGAKGLALKQYKYRMDGPLTTDDNFFNRELNLTTGENVIRAQLDERNREALELTEERGLILEYPSRDLNGFYRILSRFNLKRGIPGTSRKWIQDLMTLGMYDIAVLRSGDEAVCATMVKTFRRTASFPFTCTTGKEENGYLDVYRLYWELIRHFSSEGFEILHSGRIPNSEDTDLYRLGWGGDKYPYFYQYFPQTTTSTEYSSKRGWKREAFGALWKHLPVSLSNTIGPYITRQFP